MKCKGKFNADVVNFHVKTNKANDGREASVDIEIGLKQEEAKKKFGDDFESLAFSTMRVMEGEDGGDTFRFLVDSVKPGSAVVFERHRVAVDDEEIECQPELLSIKPVEGEAKVVAKIRLSVDVGKKALLNKLCGSVGQVVKIAFNPQQGTLNFQGANGNGHDEDDDENDDVGEPAGAPA